VEEIDRFLEDKIRGGEPPLEALRRHVLGVGTPGARLILLECAASGESPGRVLHTRLARLRDGLDEPVLEGRGDPADWAEAGAEACALALWPWEPPESPAAGRTRHRDPGGTAATAGKYHEALDADEEHREHREELVAIVRREQRRTDDVLRKVGRDLRAFEKPERHRRWGEALLAGLSVARRREDHAIVPDPYDAAGALIEVPAPAGVPLARIAEEHFRRHRRALRGLEAAERRARAVRARAGELTRIRDSLEAAERDDPLAKVEAELRGLGIPVGLEPAAVRATTRDKRSRARLEGVRLFLSSDGVEILAGRSGRHNDRLTFRVAGPEDFWFHALNWPGAHVVARNPDRRTRPPEATLREAAAIAAWFSEGREQDRLDVQWTRRKYVRRIRGAARGRVRIKRFETVRVRPGLPAGQGESL
jgi:predicted ribosome quality control (RQC) complex YloA/Tae2 family protein